GSTKLTQLLPSSHGSNTVEINPARLLARLRQVGPRWLETRETETGYWKLRDRSWRPPFRRQRTAAMRRQQIATQPLREETIYEDVPELYTEHMPDEGANEHHAGEIEEEIDSAETQITSFFHNRDLFERYCVVDGHSDLQAGTRRSTMDQVEFLTMLRMLGLTDDSHNSPTVDCLRPWVFSVRPVVPMQPASPSHNDVCS
ncbi:MAG: hypothetical protein ACPIOQ_25500, partial [Promethearchaeia archaeon]